MQGTNNSLTEIIKDELSTRKRHYIESPYSIIEHYNSEQKNIEAYNGRQLLEMIQNADDASITDKEKIAFIHLKDNVLTIANNGEPFSEGGIISLMYSDLSPKIKEQNKIGQKGLGFRSVLSWADEITIDSYDLHLSFSRQHSIDFLQQLINEKTEIRQLIKRKTDEEFPIATLRCPKVHAPRQIVERDYDTIIELRLKSEVINDVQAQIINENDQETLLFLNNLEKIIIESPERNENIVKGVQPNKTVHIEVFDQAGEVLRTKHWYVIEKKDTHKGKNYELKIAWTDNLDDNKDVLYSFFKTTVHLGFPALVHGTFELSDNRKNLNQDTHGHNMFLFNELTHLFIEAASLIAKIEPITCFKPLKLLFCKVAPTDPVIQQSGMIELLYEAVKTANLLPLIIDKYTSWDGAPSFSKYPFAELINPTFCPSLMKYTEDEQVLSFLELLGIDQLSLSPKTALTLLHKTANKIAKKDFSCLIYYTVKEYSIDIEQESAIELPSIFYDRKDNMISFTQPIFMPMGDRSFSLPENLYVQVIDEDLANELKTCFETEDFNELAQELSCFRVKPYQFIEIAKYLLIHNKNNDNNLQLLHQSLFGLFITEYRKNDHLPELSVDITIQVFSRKGKKINCSDAYFGKEYGNTLNDWLYAYDQNKFVGSKKRLGLESYDEAEISAYLNWLGVASHPRKKIIEGDENFAELTMSQFDFREKIDDLYFKNIEEYLNSFHSYSKIQVESYDELDQILDNCLVEELVCWVHDDENLRKSLENNYEQNSESVISIWFHYKQDTRKVRGRKIKSFLKWKISSTNWVRTISGNEIAPDICTISRTVTEEFSPLIEIPKIDYNHIALQEAGLKKENTDYYLTLLGIHRDISSFSAKTLYSILSQLPEIDSEGKKARTIYREIIENYDDRTLSKSNEAYVGFLKDGIVYSKKEKEFEYKPISEVYYVDNKTYGESIINQFYTLALDRRRGKDKVRKVLGVKPLEDLELILEGEPERHPLQSEFTEELEFFKPYVYAFRKDKDTKGDQRNSIKDAKFYLVKNAQFKLHVGEDERKFQLFDFEFVYLRDTRSTFIKVPIYIKTIPELRQEITFCESIAEAFATILKVDTDRSIYRELFSRSPQDRDEILRSELVDLKLEHLEASRNALNIVSDPKIQFWEAIFKCFPKKRLSISSLSDINLNALIKKCFPNSSDFLERVFDRIDYENPNENDTLSLIRELFLEIDIEIEEFNKYAFREVDLTQLYYVELKTISENHLQNFKQILFEKINSGNIQEKKSFIFKIQEFKDVDIRFSNTLKTDIENTFKSWVFENFKIDLSNSATKEIDLNEKYRANKESLKDQISQMPVPTSLLETFLNQIEHSSLLYFGELKELKGLLKKTIRNLPEPNAGNGKFDIPKRLLNIGDKQLYFEDYEELAKQLTELKNTFLTPIKRIKTNRLESTTKGKSEKKKKRKKRHFGISKKMQEEFGFVGEFIAYHNLLQTQTDVHWVSENARKAGIEFTGDVGEGYDITYLNRHSKRKYVEVKAVSSNDSEFPITPNEVQTGEKLKSNYEVILVINPLDTVNLRIEILANLFQYKKGECFNHNSNFSVENDNYRIKFKRKD